MAAPYKTLFIILEILKFLNHSYFDKFMTRKPKSGICYLRGFCGHVKSHENQEFSDIMFKVETFFHSMIVFWNIVKKKLENSISIVLSNSIA